ncbi:MAG: ribonuclease E/G, partial [Alphaproteobacteria bacterium]
MAIRMLIDASHKEETRVAVVKGNQVEEFDYEAAAKKQLKGNIYLAKVTRVEPSLQAAFVDYGGNRHGFLAFSEIHPDYYQIPVADREALIAEEASAQAELQASEEAEIVDADSPAANDDDESGDDIEAVDTGDVEDIHEELPRRPKNLKRRYKIQEVIKRRQVLLVQVVKEERGTKGAALTTYLSLAGRYCVLMPNTHHGGGVSRKIGSAADRRRLKTILSSLEMPEGMGCIIRTAGLSRTKAEIKRDLEYLMRCWDDIRELTLKSVAPALIYEEGDLIKRAIRDLYSRDIDEVLVEGEEGYKTAKAFMKLLMPSHTRKVRQYRDKIPLFHRYQVEGQLDSMYNPVVQLKSGGYIVINPTEALVAIDVNSGKATKEHNIEETALRTNLETAEEVARQLRLRDMAGLIVIDFIDMEDRANNRKVERRLKECLKADRARIQVGKISPFGLLEMSRQRLRPGILEASTRPCPHCEGTGIVRSTESSALHVLRSIEEEGIRERSARIDIHVPTAVALYLLNEKRMELHEIEERYGFEVWVHVDDSLAAPHFRMERTGASRGGSAATGAEPVTVEGTASEQPHEKPEADAAAESEDDGAPRNKRRRRGRRGGRRRKAAQSGETRPVDGAAQDDASPG